MEIPMADSPADSTGVTDRVVNQMLCYLDGASRIWANAQGPGGGNFPWDFDMLIEMKYTNYQSLYGDLMIYSYYICGIINIYIYIIYYIYIEINTYINMWYTTLHYNQQY